MQGAQPSMMLSGEICLLEGFLEASVGSLRRFRGALRGSLGVHAICGGDLNPYIPNQNISKWHFSPRKCHLDGAFSV